MKSLIFKQQIWQGKQNALATYGEAVTRRLITPQPETISGDVLGQSYIYFNSNPNPVKLPYQPCEIVYLREAFYKPDENHKPVFRADFAFDGDCEHVWKWQSPYAMSEALARTFFRIKDVRPERLQAIEKSPEDYKLEGYFPLMIGKSAVDGKPFEASMDFAWFEYLWDSTSKKYPYSVNPWVWRISFEQAERPGL